MAILHGKQGLLCDKKWSLYMQKNDKKVKVRQLSFHQTSLDILISDNTVDLYAYFPYTKIYVEDAFESYFIFFVNDDKSRPRHIPY